MSKPKVILTRKWPAEAEAKAQELFDVVLNEDDHKMSVEELKAAMQTADAICPTVSDFQINSEEILVSKDARARSFQTLVSGLIISIPKPRKRRVLLSPTHLKS